MIRKYPELKFVISKKKELETFLSFLNEAKYRDNKREMNWAFYQPHPRLRETRDKKLNYKKKFVKNYIDNFYRKNIASIKKGMLSIKKDWKRKEKHFFSLVDEIFKNAAWPEGKYIAYPTIWGMYPRFLKDKTFQIPYIHKRRNYIPVIIAHEMLHFMFYGHVLKKNPKLKRHKHDFDLWHISEIFNAIIQNSPEWIRVFQQKTTPYPEHKKHIKKLGDVWKQSKDIDIWIKKAFDYLKKYAIKSKTK